MSQREIWRIYFGGFDGPHTSGGDSGKPWRGVDPTKKGRCWSVPKANTIPSDLPYPEDYSERTVQERLDILDSLGLIYWPKKRNGVPRYKLHLKPESGLALQDIITDIPPLSSHAKEKLGYPTQKPLALLKRIISVSSNEGDVIFDPFCGCGTTIYASQELKRKWIGCDIAMPAIKIIKSTLYVNHQLHEKKDYFVTGLPVTVEQAQELFKSSPLSFQTWVIESVQGVPTVAKSRDKGIDGKIWFYDEDGKILKNMVISVKGGETINPANIRELSGVLAREKDTVLAGFLSIAEPSKSMRQEAATAGMYEYNGETFPRIQLLTVKEILEEGKTFKTPKRLEIKESKIDLGQEEMSIK